MNRFRKFQPHHEKLPRSSSFRCNNFHQNQSHSTNWRRSFRKTMKKKNKYSLMPQFNRSTETFTAKSNFSTPYRIPLWTCWPLRQLHSKRIRNGKFKTVLHEPPNRRNRNALICAKINQGQRRVSSIMKNSACAYFVKCWITQCLWTRNEQTDEQGKEKRREKKNDRQQQQQRQKQRTRNRTKRTWHCYGMYATVPDNKRWTSAFYYLNISKPLL